MHLLFFFFTSVQCLLVDLFKDIRHLFSNTGRYCVRAIDAVVSRMASSFYLPRIYQSHTTSLSTLRFHSLTCCPFDGFCFFLSSSKSTDSSRLRLPSRPVVPFSRGLAADLCFLPLLFRDAWFASGSSSSVKSS